MIENWTITPQNRTNLFKRIEELDPNIDWVASVVPKKSKRTAQQNARYWAFLTDFGKYLGYTKDEMHDICRMKFLSERAEINGEQVTKLKSTPKEGTKEFAEYCEHCERWAAENGFVWGDR